MSTSPSSAPSPSISKSEYYSSLPWFRRWLAMLNWRPVVDYELREIEFEKRKIAHKQRMKQLRSEISQIERENERLAELNAKLSAILSNSAINSNPANPTPSESEM
jgi:hypothetical protein